MAFSITSFLRSGFTDKFHLLHAKSKAYHLLCDTLQFLCTADIEDDEHIKPLSSYENMRLQEALELLQTTEMSITDVAQRVGYEYQTSFTAAVKHFFGVTPRQLRSRAKRE